LTLTAEARGHASRLHEIVVEAGHDLTGIDLVLAAEAKVLGRVLARDGAPIAGATVTAIVSEGGDPRAGRMAADRTDKDGAFRLPGLSAGQLHVDAEAPERGRASFGPAALACGTGDASIAYIALCGQPPRQQAFRPERDAFKSSWQAGPPACLGDLVRGSGATLRDRAGAVSAGRGRRDLPSRSMRWSPGAVNSSSYPTDGIFAAGTSDSKTTLETIT